MNAIQNMLDNYGRNMGIDQMGQGTTAMTFDSGEQVALECRGSKLVVLLSYELPEYEVDEVAEKLLQLSHYQMSPDYQIHPGMIGVGCLVMSIFVSPGDASIDYLDGAIRRLRSHYRELTGKAG